MAVRNYRDLIAWQLADELDAEVIRLVSGPTCHDEEYRSEILAASSGMPANIVEGFLRCSPGDFARFLAYSISSQGETEQRLRNGIRRKFFTDDECAKAFLLFRRCTVASVRLKQSQIRRAEELRRRKDQKKE